MSRRTWGTLAILFGLLLAGCTAPQGDDNDYQPPANSAASATLQGKWGTYIERVDEQHVASSDVYTPVFGGNCVDVSPDTHLIQVTVHRQSGAPADNPQGGGGVSVRMSFGGDTTLHFNFVCVAGHTYTFSPNGLTGTGSVKVTDESLHHAMIINADGTDEPAD